MENSNEAWYRFEDFLTASFGDSYSSSSVRVRLVKFDVVKKTPKGVWIGFGTSKVRFCRLDSRRKYACPSVEEAKESFLNRKRTQISIYKNRIKMAEAALSLVQKSVEHWVPGASREAGCGLL